MKNYEWRVKNAIQYQGERRRTHVGVLLTVQISDNEPFSSTNNPSNYPIIYIMLNSIIEIRGFI